MASLCLNIRNKLNISPWITVNKKRGVVCVRYFIDKQKFKMEKEAKSYEDAIAALNGLQSNASVLKQSRKEMLLAESTSLQQMEMLMERINLKVSDLDQLNVIHISGTKGKGSVAAFCESIMRHSGFRTGFYSSPHLVEVRERIRINGRPLDRGKFTDSFFECYDSLIATTREYNGVMPAYFRFLTLLAYHVFLQEKVDVVVMEVGVGGTYDCTNVIRNPTVCGISKLELDHTRILGNTIKQIAWHKSGIMKPDVPVIALPQVEEAEDVLFGRAKELKTNLLMAPPLSSYDGDNIEVGLEGKHQETNASLALQLCRLWIHQQKKYILDKKKNCVSDGLLALLNSSPHSQEGSKYVNPFKLPSSFLEGVKKTSWPGRCQVIKRNNLTFYIDGAHTVESIKSSAEWVMSRQDKDLPVSRDEAFRVLVFSVTGDRDESCFLKVLSNIGFDHAVFCPAVLDTPPGGKSSDLTNFNVTVDTKLRACDKSYKYWLALHNTAGTPSTDTNNNSHCTYTPNIATLFPSVNTAIKWVACGKDIDIEKPDNDGPTIPDKLVNSKHVQVVVTGSLHLVGTVMTFLGPSICQI